MINIAEILKQCPKGIMLYSPIFGECRYSRVVDADEIMVERYNPLTKTWIECVSYKFTRYGFIADGECLLFPSKEQRDWSKFEIPEPEIKLATPVMCGMKVRPYDWGKQGKEYVIWQLGYYQDNMKITTPSGSVVRPDYVVPVADFDFNNLANNIK